MLLVTIVAYNLGAQTETLTFDALTTEFEFPFVENGITWDLPVTNDGIALAGGLTGVSGDNAAEITALAGALSWHVSIDIIELYINSSLEDPNFAAGATIDILDGNGVSLLPFPYAINPGVYPNYLLVTASDLDFFNTPSSIVGAREIVLTTTATVSTNEFILIDELKYENAALSTKDHSLDTEKVKIYSVGKDIYINASNQLNNTGGNVLLFDIGGRLLLNKKIEGADLVKIPTMFSSGLIIVKYIQKDFVAVKKVVIK